MKPWRRISSRSLVDDRWCRLRADRCELSDGRIIDPYYVLEEHDWAHIVAVDPQGRICLVEQYRHGAGVFCWELPGGVIDPGENPLEAAQRELREETGCVAEDWKLVLTCFANPARQTNRVLTYICKNARIVGALEPDEHEELRTEFVAVDEVHRRIADGRYSQSLHIASFLQALRVLGL